MLESLEAEVQQLADQRHDEVLSLLLDSLTHQTGELEVALSRYVNLKLRLHRMKRRMNQLSLGFWTSEVGKNDEALSKEYNIICDKVKEARREYYGIKNGVGRG